MTANRLLVIDDEPNIAEFVRDVAAPLGYDVRIARNGGEFLALCRQFEPTVVVLDLQMPGADGIQLLGKLRRLDVSPRVIVMSGMDAKVLATAKRLGGEYGLSMIGVLQKPMMISDLEGMLQQCVSPPEQSALTSAQVGAGLDAGEFRLHFQPIVELQRDGGDHDFAAEALLRWRHPVRGLLAPGDFWPLIQQGGLTQRVADYVLERALEQMSLWRDDGRSARVSVNLDPEIIDDLEFPDRVAGLLDRLGIAPASLVLEVTERGGLADLANSMNVLARLRLKGIGLAIDDFGTGNSSLIQLHQMPFTELKIDRSFVGDMTSNADSRVIVQTLVDLAHNLGMTACAEGIETQATMSALTTLGCDRAQGYLIARPMSAEDLIRWQSDREAGAAAPRERRRSGAAIKAV